MYRKVENEKLVRDVNSKAIISTDTDALTLAKRLKENRLSEFKATQKLVERINTIEQKLDLLLEKLNA